MRIKPSKTFFRKLLATSSLFVLGAIGYFFIEIVFRGHSHWSMMLCGGISLAFIGGLNAKFPYAFLPVKAAICAVFITAVELIFGIFDNVIMGWQVWDYSEMPLNFMGQICLSFSLCWYLLSIPLCILTANLAKKSAE